MARCRAPKETLEKNRDRPTVGRSLTAIIAQVFGDFKGWAGAPLGQFTGADLVLHEAHRRACAASLALGMSCLTQSGLWSALIPRIVELNLRVQDLFSSRTVRSFTAVADSGGAVVENLSTGERPFRKIDTVGPCALASASVAFRPLVQWLRRAARLPRPMGSPAPHMVGASRPPSTGRATPVIQSASSDARNTAVRPMSRGVPNRGRGVA